VNDVVLVYNAGSSSIKFALFSRAESEPLERLFSGSISGIGGTQATFTAHGVAAGDTTETSVTADNHSQALHIILDWLERETTGWQLTAAGHRVVHGGTEFCQPVRVDEAVLARLKALIPLAPLHQPYALHAIEALMARYPHLPQVACFDTAFHATMPAREYRLALPDALLQQGIRRYGFHGLSYESITRAMATHLGDTANGRVVIAHLGHGVSMCAVRNGQSIATTMGFTPLDGLPMGRRSGSIDPAVVLYLLAHGKTAPEISDLLHQQSGLLGLSGISDDMRTLLASIDAKAEAAIDTFCYRINRELGSLAAALDGLDAVIFTGGIGMYAAPIRERICRAASWLGIELDAEANRENALRISSAGSRVSAWAMPTNEEQVIAHHTAALLAGNARLHKDQHGKGDES
jgi:acetate kinase